MEGAIVIYDSGIGGIPTLLALRARLPFENYIYLADNLNMPYGEKSVSELVNIARESVIGLKSNYEIKMLVLACNTLTAAAAKTIRADFPSLITIGTEPNVKQATKNLKEGDKALVLVTASTRKNLNFNEKFPNRKRYDVLSLPYLAAAIESGYPREMIYERLFRDLSGLKGRYKSLVLGCTHYYYVKEILYEILGSTIYESTDGVVNQAVRKLSEAGFLTKRSKKGSLTLNLTAPSLQILKKYIKYVK